MLRGKKIILGISGGIAAYKSAFLIRLFKKAGAEVKVVVSSNALEFITRTTIETLSENKLYSAVFSSDNDYSTEHVSLTDWGDLFVVAPATANIIGKFACGIADDALSTSFMAFNKPVFIAPAMNVKMFENFAVKQNIKTLENNGIQIIKSPEGFLACGYEGKGRMEEPEKILEIIEAFFNENLPLKDYHALVTAGPTFEPIDPVRFLGNHSTGTMGFAVAEQLALQGANVTLVAGPTALKLSNSAICRIDVQTAAQMKTQCLKYFKTADIIVMSAAVADYTPAKTVDKKIKKESGLKSIELKPTEDILLSLGKLKAKSQLLVGFALETDNEAKNALSKLNTKNLDFIVLNSLKEKGAGFGYDTNKITIIENSGKITKFGLKSKTEVAVDIVTKIIQLKKKISKHA
jgi:phosphopantothenoylcysteine decarboxylase / phosphopantothenate---cysteine ligase